ncbi:hypothetical protein [Stenotrophomonas rhizophila]|uniref:hypothetical protein n=1 Tax=Stenotrophomonas rhizophila TaxID=216778 RepID=UPI001E378AF4|nr:hypothetical protein [Stenotrophomonas rhizophila]MCC7633269.1 hypothetical protein [Stenotrophomonas rhizophila]MCC7662161.1 hypothetical protein [Stenotrophomonas rhizophila]
MSKVGFNGGSTLFNLGCAQAVAAFFSLIRAYTKPFPDRDWSLVTDRLYRRYVRQEDVALTRELLIEVSELFSKINSTELHSFFDVDALACGGLDLEASTLDKTFARYFEAAFECMHSAEVNFAKFSLDAVNPYSYEPLLIIRSQLPAFMIDKQIPLSAYDELDGDPFWLKSNR